MGRALLDVPGDLLLALIVFAFVGEREADGWLEGVFCGIFGHFVVAVVCRSKFWVKAK